MAVDASELLVTVWRLEHHFVLTVGGGSRAGAVGPQEWLAFLLASSLSPHPGISQKRLREEDESTSDGHRNTSLGVCPKYSCQLPGCVAVPQAPWVTFRASDFAKNPCPRQGTLLGLAP